MASLRPTRELGLACLSVMLLICHTDGAGSINTLFKSSDSAGDKVSLTLYYESLCPYCASFIVNQLVKVFQTDVISIVNLRLVPWGNTLITPNGSWICQHGPHECILDMVEACAINAWPTPEIHFRFIHCIESLGLKNLDKEWQSCFGSLGLDAAPIRDCFNSGLAVKGYADETARLNPPHRFVPWVLVNNQPLQEDFENFMTYVCKSYKGSELPQACSSHLVCSNSTAAVSFTLNLENSTSLSAALLAQAGNLWFRS